MCPPAKTIIISADPIAKGASAPAPFPTTVQPMVNTRKNVPSSSVMYLFMPMPPHSHCYGVPLLTRLRKIPRNRWIVLHWRVNRRAQISGEIPQLALDFANRRKLDYVTREKRILWVAFSRNMVTFAGGRDDDGRIVIENVDSSD